jgi:hypothetical protein
MLNLGSMDLRGVCWWKGKGGDVGWASSSMGNGNWVRKLSDSNRGGDNRSDFGNLNLWGWSNWEVGGSNSESVDRVSDVVHSLSNSIGINITISSSNVSEGVLALRLGRWTSSIAVTVLAELILGMELR